MGKRRTGAKVSHPWELRIPGIAGAPSSSTSSGQSGILEAPTAPPSPGSPGAPLLQRRSLVLLSAVALGLGCVIGVLFPSKLVSHATEYTWDRPGPLGLQLRPLEPLGSMVTAVKRAGVPSSLVGLQIVAVAGADVRRFEHSEILARIRSSDRPLTIAFDRSPQKASETAAANEELHQWGEERGVRGSARLAAVTMGGRPMTGLVLTDSVCPGSEVLSVPRALILTSSRASELEEIQRLTAMSPRPEAVSRFLSSQWKLLLVVVIFELSAPAGHDSPWTTWLRFVTSSLPTEQPISQWAESDLVALAGLNSSTVHDPEVRIHMFIYPLLSSHL